VITLDGHFSYYFTRSVIDAVDGSSTGTQVKIYMVADASGGTSKEAHAIRCSA